MRHRLTITLKDEQERLNNDAAAKLLAKHDRKSGRKKSRHARHQHCSTPAGPCKVYTKEEIRDYISKTDASRLLARRWLK